VYLASVLVSETGYATDSAFLQSYASRHEMATLMSNHGGATGGYVSAGRSAFWSPDGRLVVAAPDAGGYLVIASRSTDGWSGELISIET
jgi:predicted amidohydrolase